MLWQKSLRRCVTLWSLAAFKTFLEADLYALLPASLYFFFFIVAVPSFILTNIYKPLLFWAVW